jgi:hypothetical protein
MDTVLNFLWEWRFVLIGLVGVIVYFIFNPADLKVRILQAILNAKQLAKQGVLTGGLQQEQWVIDNIYLFLNRRWAKYISLIGEDKLREMIKYLYKTSIDFIDDGKLNKSI